MSSENFSTPTQTSPKLETLNLGVSTTEEAHEELESIL